MSVRFYFFFFFFFKQKTAYEMRISDWSSDVCSSDLDPHELGLPWLDRGCHRLDGVPDRRVVDAPQLLDLVEQAERAAVRVVREDHVEIGRASCRERVCQYV